MSKVSKLETQKCNFKRSKKKGLMETLENFKDKKNNEEYIVLLMSITSNSQQDMDNEA